MSFHLEAGRLIIDKAGVTRLDTDDKLLHGVSSGFNVSGSLTIPTLTASPASPVDSTTTYNLGAVTSGHTQIIGAVKFDLNNSAAGLAFDRWHMVMGGTIVWVMDGEPGLQSAVGDNSDVRQFVGYSFRVSGGQAQMVRRAFLTVTGGSYSVTSHTITYKLRSGNWT